MAPVGQGDDWDHTKEALYGLGKERPVELFYKLALVDVAKRSAVPLCQFIHTGDMQRLLHDAYLRPDGRGIDYYGAAQNVDVMGVIDRRLYTPITTMLKRAQSTGNVNGARSCTTMFLSSTSPPESAIISSSMAMYRAARCSGGPGARSTSSPSRRGPRRRRSARSASSGACAGRRGWCGRSS